MPLIVLLALVYAFLDSRSGIVGALRLRADLDAAQARIDAIRSRNDDLRSQAMAFREDPFAREQAIREGLDLARPGEILVRIPREDGRSPRIP